MSEFLHELMVLLTSSPYLYLFFLLLSMVLLAIILLVVFRKQVIGLIKRFFAKYSDGTTLRISKHQSIAFKTSNKKRKTPTGTTIQRIEMDKSEIDSVTGHVTMRDVKMKKSHIRNIRSD